jgi:hypothetical protein
MTKIKTRQDALLALKSNHNVYEILRFFVTSKQADADVVFKDYLVYQGYSSQRSESIANEIIKYLQSPLEKRTYGKLTKLGKNIPLSLLIILSEQAEQYEYDDFKLWNKTLAEPLITVFLIDDDPAGCYFLTVLTNFSQENIVTIGHALNYDDSIEPVLMAQADLLVVDHMLPRYDGFEVM